MMASDDITIEILKSIRDEIRTTNVRLDETRTELSERIDGLSARIDDVRTELSERIGALTHRVVESELRTATAIADLAGTVREMTGVMRAANDLRPRVEQCEKDIAELKRAAAGRS